MEDRRLFRRIKLKCELRFQDPVSGKSGRGRTLDICASGVGFVTDELLSPKTPLEIWLIIPDHHEPLYSRAEVVWAQCLTGSDKERVGVRLEKENLIGIARAMWIKEEEPEPSKK